MKINYLLDFSDTPVERSRENGCHVREEGTIFGLFGFSFDDESLELFFFFFFFSLTKTS